MDGSLATRAFDSVIKLVVRLPRALWSGTGGFAPARALGMEIKRRGGTVRRFDHGGTMSMMAEPYFLAHQEFAVSTDYVVPSPAVARQAVWDRLGHPRGA